MEYQILPIDKSNLKKENDRFAITIGGTEFIFEIFWNDYGQFFSFNLYDQTDNPIIVGKKIVYGFNWLRGITDIRLPAAKIICIDKTGYAEKTGITYENFMASVIPLVIEDD
jgi:hypothetical protein